MNSPDRRTDDALFADLFPTTGLRTTLAQLMNTTSSSVTQQLAQENRDKSYFHCGKLALYAGYMIDRMVGGARGEVLWADLVRLRQTLLGLTRGLRERFPSRLAYEVIEVETNSEDRSRVPVAQRRERVRQLISELEEYDAWLASGEGEASRDGEGPQAGQAGADSPRPRPVAASSKAS